MSNAILPHRQTHLHKSLTAMALIVFFAIATLFLTRPQATTSATSVSGLITLTASAHIAMPYGQALANQKPTLMEFYADWCTTCQALAPALAEVYKDFSPGVNLVMLNIDDPQWRSQIQQFHVSGVPHIVLLNGDQSVADSFVGEVPKSILRDRLTHLLG